MPASVSKVVMEEGAPALVARFADCGVNIGARDMCVYRLVAGRCVGGFAFTGYGAHTIQMHFVGDPGRWLSRALLTCAFEYAFDHVAVKVILGYIEAARQHAREVASHLGFREFGIIPGVDIHMFTMVRSECRWLRNTSRGLNG